MRLLGSLAVHAVLLGLLRLLDVDDAPAPHPPVEITVVEPPTPQPPTPRGQPGGGAPGVVPGARRTAVQHAVRTRASARDEAWAIATLRIDAPDGGEHSQGTGAGGGFGGGLGDGEGGYAGGLEEPLRLALPPPPPPPSPPARVSRARPPKLVYPVRDVEVDPSRLFVARITVDEDGDVVGARLVKGFDRPRQQAAADAIRRFHYAPALDDAGRCVRVTFDQEFELAE